MVFMQNWMKQLSHHYHNIRCLHPDDKLIILFDIDGTILDMRAMMLHVLKSFDRHNQTDHFTSLTLDAITVHENQIDVLLDCLCVPRASWDDIIGWYADNLWSNDTIYTAHLPYIGVMEVIRWFQIQPNTFVGLNTGRPDTLREETLNSLNRLGKAYKVHFSDMLLSMNSLDWEQGYRHPRLRMCEGFKKTAFGYLLLSTMNRKT